MTKTIERQAKQITKLEAEVTRLDERAQRAEHFIVENANYDDSPFCRCELCREVGKGLAEAGFMENVKDRWWESA